VGAAKIVEREVGETGLSDDFVQDSIRHVSIVEGFPLLRSEEDASRVAGVAETCDLFLEHLEVVF